MPLTFINTNLLGVLYICSVFPMYVQNRCINKFFNLI